MPRRATLSAVSVVAKEGITARGNSVSEELLERYRTECGTTVAVPWRSAPAG